MHAEGVFTRAVRLPAPVEAYHAESRMAHFVDRHTDLFAHTLCGEWIMRRNTVLAGETEPYLPPTLRMPAMKKNVRVPASPPFCPDCIEAI